MLTLFIAELNRQWAAVKVYPAEAVAEVFMLAVLFCLLFWGSSYMAGATAQFGDRLDSIFVGYVAWLLLIQTYTGIAYNLRHESEMGTLLQLMTSPFSLSQILLMRSFARVAIDVVSIVIVAALIMLVTGSRVHPSILSVPLVAAEILAAIGLGFLVAALVFRFRKIDALLMILQTAVLFVVMVPVENWGNFSILASGLLPVTPSAAALRSLLVHEQFSPLLCCLAFANAALYLAVGMVIFRKAEARAKRHGLVGAY